jgi:hypothetical protein
MIVLNIAEWIANLLILGISALIWFVALFGFAMLLSIFYNYVREVTNYE